MLYESASDVGKHIQLPSLYMPANPPPSAVHSPRLPVSLSSPILSPSFSSQALSFLARPIPTYPSAPSSPVPPSPDTPVFAVSQTPLSKPSVWVTPSTPHTFRAFRLEFSSPPPGLGLGVGLPQTSLGMDQHQHTISQRIFSGSSNCATPRPSYDNPRNAMTSSSRGRTSSIKRPGSHNKSRLPRQRAFVLSPTPNSPRLPSPAPAQANERLKDFRALVAKMRSSASFGSSSSQVFGREDSDWTDGSDEEEDEDVEDDGAVIQCIVVILRMLSFVIDFVLFKLPASLRKDAPPTVHGCGSHPYLGDVKARRLCGWIKTAK
ncbi:hypothetical protein PENSPDRAFT_734666 [Peniophora sp. CONT]|nr:hypothetical protein PENSPDRAFT_734666 [Peniophora sp. CONT]